MLLRPLPSSFQFPISSNPTSSLLTKPIRLHPRSLCTPAPTPVPDPTPTPASDSTATGKTRRPRRPTNSVDIIWGTRASRYFEKQPIENVEVDGVEIDWEGELDKGFVHEINFLEWESVAFHPSPLVVIVFERYKRAMENWNFMREFQKAAKVFWSSKDRLPPRTVRLDINIETDLAHALKVREAPQVLFLRGNRILYREKEFRTADDLVKMIAFFYYNARMPPCINEAKVARYPF